MEESLIERYGLMSRHGRTKGSFWRGPSDWVCTMRSSGMPAGGKGFGGKEDVEGLRHGGRRVQNTFMHVCISMS